MTVPAAVAERDAIQANLLVLDGSFGKRLLEGAVLTSGSSAPCSTNSRANSPRNARWPSRPKPRATRPRPGATSAGPIPGCEPNARAVRFGLECGYRALALLTPDQARRVELIDMANAIRPRTLT
jgi:hypothetical protein